MTSLAGQLGAASLVGADGRDYTRDDLAALGASDGLATDRPVALCLRDPVALIRALAALDGRTATMLLLSGALDADTVRVLVERTGCGALVTDRDDLLGHATALRFEDATAPGRAAPRAATTWLLTTSGTTGTPKIVPHTLKSLTRSVFRFTPKDAPNWGLLYDPTRFAGLQVTLQALVGGGRLLAVDTHEPIAAQIAALAAMGCTHLSATPTLWRRVLMVPDHKALSLRQITLGGEIADQAVIDALRAAYPAARVTHIYASTEAGVGFSVNDGRAGFPADYLALAPGGVKLKIVDDILWLRPPLGPSVASPEIAVDAEGYIRSGDLIEAAGDRLQFLGREGGLINVGGVKIYPETVEDAVKSVPGVALVQVSSKKNPITGTLVLAEVQLNPGADPAATKQAILDTCRARLVREAVPAIVRFVEGFEINAAGKLVRKGGAPT